MADRIRQALHTCQVSLFSRETFFRLHFPPKHTVSSLEGGRLSLLGILFPMKKRVLKISLENALPIVSKVCNKYNDQVSYMYKMREYVAIMLKSSVGMWMFLDEKFVTESVYVKSPSLARLTFPTWHVWLWLISPVADVTVNLMNLNYQLRHFLYKGL